MALIVLSAIDAILLVLITSHVIWNTSIGLSNLLLIPVWILIGVILILPGGVLIISFSSLNTCQIFTNDYTFLIYVLVCIKILNTKMQ